MAIIGKIREKSGLVATFVGIGLLAFIIPFNDLMRQFTGQGTSSIGLFNESEIEAADWNYNNRYLNAQNNFRYNNINSGGTGSLSNEDEDQVKLNTWNQMISDTIYYMQLNKVGISVSAEELNQGLLNGENPLPSSLKELFTNNGLYNKDSFNIWKTNRIINLPDNADSRKDLKNNIENPLKNERRINKYGSMLKYGLLNTIQEGKRAIGEENSTANIKYTFINYESIADSNIDLNNEARKDFFNDHRNEKMWQQNQELRSYDYAILSFNPSSKDIANYSKRMESLKQDFQTTDDDSSFVANYSETPIITASPYGPRPSGNFTNEPYKGGKFPSFIDQQINNSKQGDVIGPFSNGNKMQLVKIYETGEQEQAKVRHILINSKDGDPNETTNKKVADSILYAIRRDSSKFKSLVTKYSDDQGSVANGGVYSWFPKGQMVPEFEEFSFEKRIGSSGVVKTNYGFHIIQVLGRKIGTFKKIAIVDETIQVSKLTQNQFYDSVALAFYYKADSNDFETAADELGFEVKSSGYVPLIFPNRRTSGFYGPRELNRNLNIAKWAFALNSEVGDIMEPEYISNNKLIIAVLTEKINENDNRFNNLKPLMDPIVENRLKASYFIEKYSKSLQNMKTIDSIADFINANVESKFVKYSDVNIGNNNQELAEPKVMAHIFNLQPLEISTIIEGKKGLYIVQVEKQTNNNLFSDDAILEKTIENQNAIRKQIEQNYYPSLYNAYNVKDHRAKNMLLNN
jgi:peptidyl-prolyl cis-trans isomerase D